MLNLIALLAGSRVGRWLALAGLAGIGLALALARARSAGVAAARLEAQTGVLDALAAQLRRDRLLSCLSPAQRRQRLRRDWAARRPG